jgi:choline monooxygenase
MIDMGSYVTTVYEDYSIQCADGVVDRIGNEAFYAWLYPGFMINRYGPVMDTNFVIPISHDKMLVVYDWYFEEGCTPEFIQSSIAASDKIQLEDIMISENVQRGLSSPAYNVGLYAPKVEQGELHFHRLLHKDYTTGEATPINLSW